MTNLDEKKLDDLAEKFFKNELYFHVFKSFKNGYKQAFADQQKKIEKLEKVIQAQDRCLDAIDDHIRDLQAQRIIDMNQMIRSLKILSIGCSEVDAILKEAED